MKICLSSYASAYVLAVMLCVGTAVSVLGSEKPKKEEAAVEHKSVAAEAAARRRYTLASLEYVAGQLRFKKVPQDTAFGLLQKLNAQLEDLKVQQDMREKGHEKWLDAWLKGALASSSESEQKGRGEREHKTEAASAYVAAQSEVITPAMRAENEMWAERQGFGELSNFPPEILQRVGSFLGSSVQHVKVLIPWQENIKVEAQSPTGASVAPGSVEFQWAMENNNQKLYKLLGQGYAQIFHKGHKGYELSEDVHKQLENYDYIALHGPQRLTYDSGSSLRMQNGIPAALLSGPSEDHRILYVIKAPAKKGAVQEYLVRETNIIGTDKRGRSQEQGSVVWYGPGGKVLLSLPDTPELAMIPLGFSTDQDEFFGWDTRSNTLIAYSKATKKVTSRMHHIDRVHKIGHVSLSVRPGTTLAVLHGSSKTDFKITLFDFRFPRRQCELILPAGAAQKALEGLGVWWDERNELVGLALFYNNGVANIYLVLSDLSAEGQKTLRLEGPAAVITKPIKQKGK